MGFKLTSLFTWEKTIVSTKIFLDTFLKMCHIMVMYDTKADKLKSFKVNVWIYTLHDSKSKTVNNIINNGNIHHNQFVVYHCHIHLLSFQWHNKSSCICVNEKHYIWSDFPVHFILVFLAFLVLMVISHWKGTWLKHSDICWWHRCHSKEPTACVTATQG